MDQAAEALGTKPREAYRLLKAIMATAVDDGLVRRNPCRIKGASVEKSPLWAIVETPSIGIVAHGGICDRNSWCRCRASGS